MPDLPRRSCARCLPIAGVVLGLVSTPVAALPLKPAPAAHVARLPAKAPTKAPDKAPAKADSVEASAATPISAKPAATWTSGEGERACFRGRRKLWQEGEGWVVKKVSVCP